MVPANSSSVTAFIMLMGLIMLMISARSEAGYFNAAMKRIMVENKDQPVPVLLFYPSEQAEMSIDIGPYNIQVAPDADISPGKFPLVLISHGSGGGPLGHRSIALHLARQGYVVAAVMHPQNNFRDNSAEGTDLNWQQRPEHLRVVMDHLYGNSAISSSLIPDTAAVIGHSAGGYTALAVAGGEADLNTLTQLCAQHPEDNAVFCQKKPGDISAPVFKERAVIPGVPDKRIKALILMAPVGAVFQNEGALNKLNVPALLMPSEHDELLPESFHAGVIKDNWPQGESIRYEQVSGAGHYAFISPLPDMLRAEISDVAYDPDGFDRTLFHQNLPVRCDSFLKEYLK